MGGRYVKDFGFYAAGVEREMKVRQAGKRVMITWRFGMVSRQLCGELILEEGN